MSKFKTGDVVKIIVTERQPLWNDAGKMDKYIGEVVTVSGSSGESQFVVYDSEYGRNWIFDDCEARLYSEYYSNDEIEDCDYDELNALFTI